MWFIKWQLHCRSAMLITVLHRVIIKVYNHPKLALSCHNHGRVHKMTITLQICHAYYSITPSDHQSIQLLFSSRFCYGDLLHTGNERRSKEFSGRGWDLKKESESTLSVHCTSSRGDRGLTPNGDFITPLYQNGLYYPFKIKWLAQLLEKQIYCH